MVGIRSEARVGVVDELVVESDGEARVVRRHRRVVVVALAHAGRIYLGCTLSTLR